MPAAEPAVTDLITDLIHEHGGAIVRDGLDGNLPQTALDAAQDLTGALHDLLAIGEQLENDRDELTRRRDLLPPDGHARLWDAAHQDAWTKTLEAERAAGEAYDRLETALQDAVLPALNPAREQLARDEAALALSTADPASAARNLALRGNPEALAALISPWGSTLLAARGVDDPDRLLRDVRRIAVDRAIRTDDTPAARALRDHVGPLGAACGTAGSAVRRHTRR